MEKFEDILALITPENSHDTVLLQAIVDCVNVTIMMETVKALAARHRQRKPRRSRRIWSWPYLQGRVELGHYDNLMEELSIECPHLYKNLKS